MKSRYQEHPIQGRLAPFVECFWSIEPGSPLPEYPVLPDGCVDILFSPSSAAGLQIVGTMTQARRFSISGKHREFGIRFRPGMAYPVLRLSGIETTDQSIPLSDICGSAGDRLSAQMQEAESPEECVGLLEAHLGDPDQPGVVQRICAAIVERRGQSRVDELAFDAAMSARQLRRLFLEQLGLSPKHFCRVIRFRDSVSRIAACGKGGDWAQVALDCGYYDQAHFINEFRELSGATPAQFASLER